MRTSFARFWWDVVWGTLAALVTFAGMARVAAAADKETAKETAARSEVIAALKAEAAGDNDERSQRLYSAWLAAPQFPEANWHTGRIRSGDEWLPLGEASSRAASDTDLAKYQELRERATSADRLQTLARWCQKHGMPDRARLHYAQLLTQASLDAATQKEAIKALELVHVGGAWFTRKEVDARSHQLREAQTVLDKWLPALRRLQQAIDGNDLKQQPRAIAEFHDLKDPAIVVALEALLSHSGPRFQEEAVKRLSSFRQYEATQALVKYAVLSSYSLTRRDAAAALVGRPLHEFVPTLLSGLKAPLKSQFQIRWDKQGRLAYDRAVLEESTTSNLLLLTHKFAAPYVETRIVDRASRPRGSVDAARLTAQSTNRQVFFSELESLRTQAMNDQAAVELTNAQRASENQRIVEVLQQATAQQQPLSPQGWQSWWQDYNEYQWPKQTYYVYQWSQRPYYIPVLRATSCFLAGTSVRTETGPRPIESIQPGDRVLAQDQDSGELTYKIVLTTTLRPPAKMVRLTIGDDSVVTTLGHPFWVNGHGWKMAKELAPGDLVHSLGGAMKVEKVEPVADAQAYNLVVDDFNTYFVGLQGLLVHDNEFRRPTRAIVPGLIELGD